MMGLDISQDTGVQVSGNETNEINENQIVDLNIVDDDGNPLDVKSPEEIFLQNRQEPQKKDATQQQTDQQKPQQNAQQQPQQQQGQPQQSPAQQQQQQQPVKPVGFDAFFYGEDNSFDAQKGLDFVNKTSQFAYQRQVSPKPEAQSQQPAPFGQPQQPAAPKDWKAELAEYKANTRKQVLGPLEELYRAGSAMWTPEQHNLFNQQYAQAQQALEQEFERRQFDILDEQLKKKDKIDADARSMWQLEQESRSVLSRVGMDVGGVDKMNMLLFGYQDDAGKIHRGHGADVVDWLFDLSHDQKQMTDQEYAEAYRKWYTKFSSNEKNVRMAVKVASALFDVSNRENQHKALRRAWEKEEQDRRSGKLNTPGSKPPGSPQAGKDPWDRFFNGQRERV